MNTTNNSGGSENNVFIPRQRRDDEHINAAHQRRSLPESYPSVASRRDFNIHPIESSRSFDEADLRYNRHNIGSIDPHPFMGYQGNFGKRQEMSTKLLHDPKYLSKKHHEVTRGFFTMDSSSH